MPVYEYECTECGHHFERQQSFTDEPIEICPVCDGQVRRVIQPVGVIFKGSGFYVTDNRRISGGSGRKGKSEGETSGEPSSNGKPKSTESSTSKSEPEKSHSESSKNQT